MAPYSSTLAWKIPWTEEPGGLQSMGSLEVRHDWATSLSLFTFMNWRRKWQPTPVFLPGESQGQGSLWAAIYGVAQSRTRLKRLSVHACIGEGNGNPLQHSCLENPRDRGACGLPSMGLHGVRHDWCDLATAADSILKSRDVTLPTKVHLIRAMVFLVVMYDVRAGL